MIRIACFGAVASACLLAGCVSPAAERQSAIETARAHCESEGKQFVLIDVNQKGIANVTSFKTIVTGNCVSAGEKGYVPPATPGKTDTPSKSK